NEKPMAIIQLSHAGRQSPNILGGRFPFVSLLEPSSIRPLSNFFHRIMFQILRAMTLAGIDAVLAAFVRGAKLAAQTGFDGIQLHAAHGSNLILYYGPSDFILGLKINAADYADSNEAGEISPALDHSVDFIEISGGDCEKPALFAEFAHYALHAVASFPRAPLILLTGGLATSAHLHAALSAPHAHLPRAQPRRCSAPRPPASTHTRPRPDHRELDFRPPLRIRLLGAGAATAWYVVALRRLTTLRPAQRPDYSVGALGGVWWMRAWFGPESWVLGIALIGFTSIILAAIAVAVSPWDLRPR
ncbi:hypothetical protein B0H19DRAFT_1183256, partial [Mycena capillaripes]